MTGAVMAGPEYRDRVSRYVDGRLYLHGEEGGVISDANRYRQGRFTPPGAGARELAVPWWPTAACIPISARSELQHQGLGHQSRPQRGRIRGAHRWRTTRLKPDRSRSCEPEKNTANQKRIQINQAKLDKVPPTRKRILAKLSEHP
jgi:hypothetical protein